MVPLCIAFITHDVVSRKDIRISRAATPPFIYLRPHNLLLGCVQGTYATHVHGESSQATKTLCVEHISTDENVVRPQGPPSRRGQRVMLPSVIYNIPRKKVLDTSKVQQPIGLGRFLVARKTKN